MRASLYFIQGDGGVSQAPDLLCPVRRVRARTVQTSPDGGDILEGTTSMPHSTEGDVEDNGVPPPMLEPELDAMIDAFLPTDSARVSKKYASTTCSISGGIRGAASVHEHEIAA